VQCPKKEGGQSGDSVIVVVWCTRLSGDFVAETVFFSSFQMEGAMAIGSLRAIKGPLGVHTQETKNPKCNNTL
jgi:hypothetical protein